MALAVVTKGGGVLSREVETGSGEREANVGCLMSGWDSSVWRGSNLC